MERKTGHWIIGLFDTLLAVLSIPLLLGNIAEVQHPDPDATANDMLINQADCGLDVLALVSQLGAAAAVVSGMGPAALLQRAVFWSLLLRTGFTFGEAFLPDEGLGGLFLFLWAVLMLVPTGLALWSVFYVQKTEQNAT